MAPREEQRSLVPPSLAPDAHKGDAGRVAVLCGSRWMPGAALLVARAAQRAGAGLVSVACSSADRLELLVPLSAPEAVLFELEHAHDVAFKLAALDLHAVVVGCGLAPSERAEALVQALLHAPLPCPLVLDAGALNALGAAPEKLAARRSPTVITPHPGEASRLLGRALGRTDPEREAAARELAKRSGAIVCLKGARTVVTDGSHVFVNDTGNSGMATAGSGDVLAGILGAYLALCATGAHENWTPLDAACAAVRTHGLAGDFAAAHLGKRALIASDLIQWLAQAQRRLES
jgi:hydroxyethylthiazole kinase-like uncharacterized protein yjeF